MRDAHVYQVEAALRSAQVSSTAPSTDSVTVRPVCGRLLLLPSSMLISSSLKTSIFGEPPKRSCAPQLRDPSTFRFLDLPPEIRSIIYDMLVRANGPIWIGTFLSRDYVRRRAVQARFHNKTSHHEEGFEFDARSGKWIGQPPSTFVVAQTNKTISGEVLPMIYGCNIFTFGMLSDFKIFLDGVGSNQTHLRHISFPSVYSAHYDRVGSVFFKLSGAKKLQTLSIDHTFICAKRYPGANGADYEGFADDVMPLLQSLCNSDQASGETFRVLDVIQVLPSWDCKNLCTSHCRRAPFCCKEGCKNGAMERHVREVSTGLRGMLAEKLGITDGN